MRIISLENLRKIQKKKFNMETTFSAIKLRIRILSETWSLSQSLTILSE